MILRRLSESFGKSWCIEKVIPQIKNLSESHNYLRRQTSLYCIRNLADVIDENVVMEVFVPILNKVCQYNGRKFKSRA